MEALSDIGTGLVSGLAYGVVGIVVFVLGYFALDLVTPGKLGDIVYIDRSSNAALVVASGLLAVGTIVTTAILTSEEGILAGLLSTFGYGLLGVVLVAFSFMVIDWVTPGDLGAMLMDTQPHPAVYVTVAAHVSVGAIVAAAIS